MSMKEIQGQPLDHGRKYEHVAVQQYESIKGFETNRCGLFVSQQHPYLASTPDRIVDENLLVEVKCPFVSRERNISHQTVPYLLNTDNGLYLDNTHSYYYQVQGQLSCSGRQACDFVVFTLKDMVIVRILRDEVFIQNMIGLLKRFYEDNFRPAIPHKYFYKQTHKYCFK